MTEVLLVCGAGEEVKRTLGQLRSAGFDAILIGIKGLHTISDKDTKNWSFYELSLGDLGRLLEISNHSGARKIVFVGRFSDLHITEVKPDFKTNLFIEKLKIAPTNLLEWMHVGHRFLADNGYLVEDVTSIINAASTLDPGFATERHWHPQEEKDFVQGRRVQKAMQGFGIAGVTVVRHGSIIAISAENEGTDKVLDRLGQYEAGEPSGVMVKWPFFDANGNILARSGTAIGLRTVKLINRANLSGVVVHRATRIWNAKEVIKFCNDNDLFLRAEE